MALTRQVSHEPPQIPSRRGRGLRGYTAAEAKLLLPSDQPDEHGFRLMWYNPVSPIDQKTWRPHPDG
jgi:hypothetical protein